MAILVALLALLALRSSSVSTHVEAITIPAQYDGYAFPPNVLPTKLPVVLEAFIDPMSPDCRTAWPTIKALVELYGSALSLIIHPFPVPFHHYSCLSVRALHVAKSLNSSAIFPLMELIFENQESFYNDATKDEDPYDVVQRAVDLAVEVGLSLHEVWDGFSYISTAGTSSNQATRLSFQYGCSKYVTSTPFYLVNGMVSEADETWSVGKWRSMLDALVREQPTLTVASYEDDGALSNH